MCYRGCRLCAVIALGNKEEVMGLFRNNKVLCPICGNSTPRVLPMRIDGQAICSECDKKASVQPEILENMTISEYAEHLAYREKNQGTLNSFIDTKVVEITKADKLHIDEKQQLLYIESARLGENPPVFRFGELTSFVYYEHLGTDRLFDLCKRDRCPVIVKPGEFFEEESFVSLFEDNFRGFDSLENVVEHFRGQDERALKREHPIDVFRFTFEFDNPYFHRLAFDGLAPYLDLDGEDPRFNGKLGWYMDQCMEIVKTAKRIARAVDPIINRK